jgi:hypothetical protein
LWALFVQLRCYCLQTAKCKIAGKLAQVFSSLIVLSYGKLQKMQYPKVE